MRCERSDLLSPVTVATNQQVYLSASSLLPEGELDRPVVFLAESLITETVRARLTPSSYDVLPTPREDRHRLREAQDLSATAYPLFCERIGTVLDRVHGVN